MARDRTRRQEPQKALSPGNHIDLFQGLFCYVRFFSFFAVIHGYGTARVPPITYNYTMLLPDCEHCQNRGGAKTRAQQKTLWNWLRSGFDPDGLKFCQTGAGNISSKLKSGSKSKLLQAKITGDGQTCYPPHSSPQRGLGRCLTDKHLFPYSI